MDLINDIGTELAFVFLVEKRYRQRIDSEAALALIARIRGLLENAANHRSEPLSAADAAHAAPAG